MLRLSHITIDTQLETQLADSCRCPAAALFLFLSAGILITFCPAKPCRPFVEPTGVDHDDGVEGMTLARNGIVRPKRTYTGGVPAHIQAQIHKDKTTCSMLVR